MRGQRGHGFPRWSRVAALLTLTAAFALVAVGSAFAAASYVFEPTLSLTGSCSKSLLDPVEDPGCPAGEHPPSGGFRSPGVTVDSYGDIYVASIVDTEARIDIFSPQGLFILELKESIKPQSLAVDSKGNLYVFERMSGGERQVRRFAPTVYKPEEEKIAYGAEPVLIANNSTKRFFELQGSSSVVVDPSTDQLYVDYGLNVARFGSVEEENKLLEKEAVKVEEEVEGKPVVRDLKRSTSIAIDGDHEKIYLSDQLLATGKSTIRIFDLKAPHKGLGEINGSTTPKGEFISGEGFLPLDVDESAGHVFVGDLPAAGKVYEFKEDGAYLATIEHGFTYVPNSEIAVDSGPESPHPQNESWLFVPSEPSPSLGHVYAFEPNEEGPPIIEAASVGDITESEATLHATINPGGLETFYRLEYVTQQQAEVSGFSEATIAGEGTLPKGGEGIEVAAQALELEPKTEYRFRAVAENGFEGKSEDQAVEAFTTFGEEPPPPCENEAFRAGVSALLADCRVYELVTPPDTNGRPPSGGFAGVYFPTLRAALDGNSATFVIEGGLIPGSKGTGAFNGDNYLAVRTGEGWSSALAGPLGDEAGATKRPSPGGVSPDQVYSFWEDSEGVFVRYPDGHSELVGKGSLGEDPMVNAMLITENGTHIVFQTTNFSHVAQQLEENAPPTGTSAVYDRSAEGPTHVVSLLPGDEPQKDGENATYLGASEDGEGIAFSIGGTIYLRLHNAETFEVAGPGTTFAGVADEGSRVFYLEGGDLFAYDAAKEETIAFSESGDVTVVNVASGGTRAYIVSPSVLTGESNPNGEEAEAGEENLYLSEEGAISFVGIVTERDVEGEKITNGTFGGLGLWISGLKSNAPDIDPSRATPAGTTFLFESRADLTGFESEGFAQVYRYDSAQSRLDCLSCSPTGAPPDNDASLQSIKREQFSPEPAGSFLKIANQNADGSRAFFQSAEPLVVGDTDQKLDVYEWEEAGVGSCQSEGGCVYLISGGQSAGPDHLYAMSASGDDVFFRTSDQLLPRDTEATLSIYDARVGGGFPEPEPKPECEGEGCHSASTPPALPTPAKPAQGANDQVVGGKKHCPKGKHLAKRHGKKVCVKNHHKKKHHHQASGAKKKGGSR